MKISKERMLEMAKKLASMDFCTEQEGFYPIDEGEDGDDLPF